jgi:hypothetical protein
MKPGVLCDAGPLAALLDRDDPPDADGGPPALAPDDVIGPPGVSPRWLREIPAGG